MSRLRPLSIASLTLSLLVAPRLVGAANAQTIVQTAVSDDGHPATASLDHPAGKRLHDGFFLRLSLGPVYLHESWIPGGGSPGAVYGGWGSSLETTIGKSVRPGLIVGGRWQFVAVVDPNESYLGTTYVMTRTAHFVDGIAAFADYYPDPRRGFHLGGSAGLLAATNLDAEFRNFSTGWGATVSAEIGYEIFFSSRWSVGALAELAAYRTWATEAGISSTTDGLLPAVAVAFTFE